MQTKSTKRVEFIDDDTEFQDETIDYPLLSLRLTQRRNNCFVNTAVQVLNRLWNQEILEYNGNDAVLQELKQIAEGKNDTTQLLSLAPGKFFQTKLK